MEEYDKFLGCYISYPSLIYGASEEEIEFSNEQGDLFSLYIWGENGISPILEKLNYENYGKDLELILLQFYVKPIPYLLQHLKEIDYYRKKEKAIGIPVIITDENFFNQSEEGRYEFLKQTILRKLDLLAAVVKRRKMDTKMALLKSDLQKLFDESGFFKQNLNTDES